MSFSSDGRPGRATVPFGKSRSPPSGSQARAPEAPTSVGGGGEQRSGCSWNRSSQVSQPGKPPTHHDTREGGQPRHSRETATTTAAPPGTLHPGSSTPLPAPASKPEPDRGGKFPGTPSPAQPERPLPGRPARAAPPPLPFIAHPLLSSAATATTAPVPITRLPPTTSPAPVTPLQHHHLAGAVAGGAPPRCRPAQTDGRARSLPHSPGRSRAAAPLAPPLPSSPLCSAGPTRSRRRPRPGWNPAAGTPRGARVPGSTLLRQHRLLLLLLRCRLPPRSRPAAGWGLEARPLLGPACTGRRGAVAAAAAAAAEEGKGGEKEGPPWDLRRVAAADAL